MKIGREIVALRRFTNAETTRPEIAGVYIDGEAGIACATNGGIAVLVPLAEKDPTFKAIIPAEVFARLPDGIEYPITLLLSQDTRFVEALFTLNGFALTMKFKTLDGKFPDVRAVIPESKDRPLKTVFNAEYVRWFADLAARHNRGAFPPPVSIEFEADTEVTKAARMTFLLPDGRRVEAAMAGVRIWEPMGQTP